MNFDALVDSLERFGRSLPHVVEGVPQEWARWKPDDGAWSILEVIRHLADEETEDFRARLRSTLEDPGAAWSPIDPVGWSVERRYNEGALSEAVDRFTRERSASVAWLRSLREPVFARSYDHPKLGPIHAGDLLAAWAAHDALHLRQIAKRMYEVVGVMGGSFSTAYAGTWGA